MYIGKTTINRWYKPFPNGWLMTLFYPHYWEHDLFLIGSHLNPGDPSLLRASASLAPGTVEHAARPRRRQGSLGTGRRDCKKAWFVGIVA